MWRTSGPSTCSEKGQHRSGCSQLWSAELLTSSRMEVPQFLPWSVMVLEHTHGKNISRSNWNFLYDILCLHCPLSCHCATSEGLCTCKSSPTMLYHWVAEAQLYVLFPLTQLSASHTSYTDIMMILGWICSSTSISFCNWEAQIYSTKCWMEGRNHHPEPRGITLTGSFCDAQAEFLPYKARLQIHI